MRDRMRGFSTLVDQQSPLLPKPLVDQVAPPPDPLAPKPVDPANRKP